MLNKQIQLYSVNTRAFYNEEEQKINNKIIDITNGINILKEYFIIQYDIKTKLSNNERVKYNFCSISDFYIKRQNKHIRKYINNIIKNNKIYKKSKELKEKLFKNEYYMYWKYTKRKTSTEKGEKSNLDKLRHKFIDLIESNNEIRNIILSKINDHNKIATFDKNLTRILNIPANTITRDIIIVKVLHYPVLYQLIDKGFNWDNEHYVFFTASAGQIRKKKIVMIKESVWTENENTITCGLSVEDINNSKEKGCNINKFLAYLALTISDTDPWENFDINKAIVIPDFETKVKGKFDYIEKKEKVRANENDKDKQEKYYELQMPVADTKDREVTITHSDGCGMILPSESKKNFQFRMPWFKGLLTPVDFIKWCDLYNNGDYTIKDIWGNTWDLKKDDIKYIFSQSQFKMYKYYSNWDDYKNKFIKYNCKVGKCNIEEDNFKNPKFNYQMWQTLTDITDIEIKHYTDPINEFISKAYIDRETMLYILGATKENNKKNYLQKCLEIYPELLKDSYIQEQLSDTINSKKKKCKCGKFILNGANTFIIPDVFAWLQWIFRKDNDIEITGLLNNGEVHCNLFNAEKYPRLIVNRSPHLYREHGLRKNVDKKEMKNWFITNGIYVSCYDTISLLLMFDVDGDHAMVISDQYLCNIVERNMKGVRPLYYEMGKAKPQQITSENIYNSMTKAFKSGNIGEFSNRITTLWNKNHFTEDTLTAIKVLTALNNYSIDSAKTNEMPELSSKLNKLLKSEENYIYKTTSTNKKGKTKQITKRLKIKMPYFYKFAKDNHDTEEINRTTVNRICNNIETIKQWDFCFKSCGRFNYHKLMNDFKIKINDNVINKYKELNKEMQKDFMKCINYDEDMSKQRLASLIYDNTYLQFEGYCKNNNIDIIDAADMIIKYIYKNKRDSKKAFLFNILGDIILTNLKINIKSPLGKEKGKYFLCKNCGKRIRRTSNRQVFCIDCANEIRKEKDRIRKRKK